MNAATIPIESPSTAENILLMERLWDDLSRVPNAFPSTEWHGRVLAERLTAVEQGTASFVDWKDAKRRLRERFP